MATRYVRSGDKLEAALSDISRNLKKAAVVRIGFLEGATYPDGTPVAMIAAIHEFGAPAAGIPPRPFFRGMIAAKSSEWPEGIEQQLVATDYDTELTLERTGAAIAGQLRQAIVDFVGVPLKPATIAAKGFDKQLVDTGHMLNSVDFEVEEK